MQLDGFQGAYKCDYHVVLYVYQIGLTIEQITWWKKLKLRNKYSPWKSELSRALKMQDFSFNMFFQQWENSPLLLSPSLLMFELEI